MPRQSRSSGRSSGSRSSSFSSGRTANKTTRSSNTSQQQPAYTSQSKTPMQQSTGGSMMWGIGSTIVQGMAFGGGSEIAHQAVRSMMGGSSSHPNEVRPNQEVQSVEQTNQQQNQNQRTNPCSEYNFKFIDCLKMNNNNISSCQTFFDDLKSCERSLIWRTASQIRINYSLYLI